MPVRLTSVVFQAVNPGALTDFWTGIVDGWIPGPAGGAELRLRPPDEDGCPLDLVFSPDQSRRKAGKNRVHLDVNSWGTRQYQARREAIPLIGGLPVDIAQGALVPWTVFADPEGNEFCLLKPCERYAGTGELAAVVVDCAEPGRLASFWSSATGWRVVENESGFASLRAPDEPPRGPFLEFSRVADRSPEPGRVRLGLESYWAHQHDGDVARLCTLGARLRRRHYGPLSYTELADPEGNEFRVVIPVWPPQEPNHNPRSVDGTALRL
jgi:hypothetical protein